MPVALADEIAALLDGAGSAEIAVGEGTITVRARGTEVGGALLDDFYPDFRRMPWDRWTPSAAAALRSAVAAAPNRTATREQDGAEFAVTELAVGPDGAVTVDAGGIGVNREFLLEAVDAGGDGQLVLSLDAPVAPLVLRSERSTSLLMPVRL